MGGKGEYEGKVKRRRKRKRQSFGADNLSVIPWRFNSSLKDAGSIFPKLRVSLEVREDGFEVKVLRVVGGLSTRVADISLFKEKERR